MATWFVDPPYQGAGKHYRFGSEHIDFLALAGWCKSRPGQVIVCENKGAGWLPFRELADVKTTRADRRSREVIWLNSWSTGNGHRHVSTRRRKMSITQELHGAFLRPLGDLVLRHSARAEKPLTVDLALPNPPRLRVYMYTLVGGVGTVRPNEYKAVLRVPGQPVGAYDSFDHSDGRARPARRLSRLTLMSSCSGMPAFILNSRTVATFKSATQPFTLRQLQDALNRNVRSQRKLPRSS